MIDTQNPKHVSTQGVGDDKAVPVFDGLADISTLRRAAALRLILNAPQGCPNGRDDVFVPGRGSWQQPVSQLLQIPDRITSKPERHRKI